MVYGLWSSKNFNLRGFTECILSNLIGKGMFRKINLSIFLIFLLLGIYFARVHLPAGTTDTYWHLSVGRQAWQEKEIAKTNKNI